MGVGFRTVYGVWCLVCEQQLTRVGFVNTIRYDYSEGLCPTYFPSEYEGMEALDHWRPMRKRRADTLEAECHQNGSLAMVA